MPDAELRCGLRGEVFVRNLAALADPASWSKGGIICPENYKSWVVNIRPKKWKEKIWIGQIDNFVDAQFIADAVYYYTGRATFHLKDVNFTFPPLECSVRGVSTLLTNREMCLTYASSIAKEEEFRAQRSDFLKKVKALVQREVKTDRVQNLLLRFRDASGSAVDEVVENGSENDEEDVQAAHSTPMEVDEHAGQASHLAQLVASSENAPDRTVHVPSFNMDGFRFTLQSDFAPVDCFSWDIKAHLDSFTNSVFEDSLSCVNSDQQDFCFPAGAPVTSSSASENFEANFFAMQDAGVDLVKW